MKTNLNIGSHLIVAFSVIILLLVLLGLAAFMSTENVVETARQTPVLLFIGMLWLLILIANIVLAIVVIRNINNGITRRKQAEGSLRESESLNRQILDATNEAICGLDMQGTTTFINPAGARMLGWETQELVGKIQHKLLHHSKADGSPCSFEECRVYATLKDGKVHSHEDEVFWRKDGSSFPVEYTSTPVFEGEEPAGAILVFRDISAHVQIRTQLIKLTERLQVMPKNLLVAQVEKLNKQLAESRNHAEIASRSKSVLLANMSYEIRTPLNAIIGLTRLMQGSVRPKQEQQLKKIDASVQHLLTFINDILDLSKIESGKLVLEQSEFQLSTIFDDVRSLLKELIGSKDLIITTDLIKIPQLLRGDPGRLSQALLNYAVNAVKFTEEGTIFLRAKLLEEYDDALLIRFEVRDTGIGIEPEKIPDLFDAFEQSNVTSTHRYGSAGLGLAITRHLAQLMDGEAGVESEPGQGSTFWFTARLGLSEAVIPAARSAEEMATETGLLPGHRGLRILLAEDNAINSEVAVALLTGAGLVVDTAENGREAVEKSHATAYDLILMDIHMPEMDGLEATRVIRAMASASASASATHKDIPILAMTANVLSEDRLACLNAGMNEFVAKPVEPDTLFSTIAKWLPLEQD